MAALGLESNLNWAVLWDVLLFFLFLVIFGKASFTLIRQHSVQRRAEDRQFLLLPCTAWWRVTYLLCLVVSRLKRVYRLLKGVLVI